MANSGDELNLLINDTMVPDVFVVQYMEQLSKNAVFYYMWIKMNYGNKSFNEEEALKAAPYPEKVVKEALAELISTGILLVKNQVYSFIDLKKREVNSYCKHVAAMGINPDTLQLTANEEARNLLAESISKTCFNGKMAYCYYTLIDKCLGEYDFTNDVVYYLFDIGKQRMIQYQYPRMCKLAEEWYKSGITTADKVDEYIKHDEDINKMTKLVGKITRKRLNEFDLTRIRKWVIDYKIDADMVEYAFRINEYRGNITTQIVEDTLALWKENGINTVDEATVFEDEKHKENKRKATKRKNKNSSWKTGSEAGIAVPGEEDTVSSEDTNSKETNNEEVREPVSENIKTTEPDDDILNLFEDDDEDD